MHDKPAHALLRDIPALAEFTVVARREHVTRAAEELGVPQSTLSRRIARLERAMGVALFHRSGRRLVLTRAGRQFAIVVERALVDLERGLVDVTRSVDPSGGTVALAFLSTLGVAVVPRLLREFRADHPELRFQLVQDGHEAVLSRLVDGDVDLCLTSPLPEDADLTALALHRQPLRLSVPSEHPLATLSQVPLIAAADEPFVGFKPGYGMRRITEDWCQRAGFTPRLAFEGEDVATVRGLVAAGLGVALLPSGPRTAGTVDLTVADLPVARTIGLVRVTDRQLPPPAQAFDDFLVAHAERLVAEATAEG
ncbi:LysR family transcriptional regulator [Nocardioides sp. AX2bis]|uniref:LysR family transcriptional regulator n=1 Tax=Nocardioides sp. AX2bis TaxID=2653157 RepID=UPI0012F0BD8B|nr:LysR family transcriptional regulator [Nocardioides sp. AX2bis]VXC36473.1 DNA-binding transcriptional LysR family regulator [Nocardioides sp. AX2bis]